MTSCAVTRDLANYEAEQHEQSRFDLKIKIEIDDCVDAIIDSTDSHYRYDEDINIGKALMAHALNDDDSFHHNRVYELVEIIEMFLGDDEGGDKAKELVKTMVKPTILSQIQAHEERHSNLFYEFVEQEKQAEDDAIVGW